MGYMPTPNQMTGGELNHNQDGYRGEAVSFYKKEGISRILFLGGSTTYSVSVTDVDSTFPAQVKQQLDQLGIIDSNGMPLNVEVMNGGLPWGTSAELLTHYIFKFKYYHPDLVVIHSGGNDAQAYDYGVFNYQPDYSHWRSAFDFLEKPQSPTRWLYKSRFLGALAINSRYKKYFNGTLHVHGGHRMPADWYRDSLYMSIPDQSAFYQNISSLVREAKTNGADVLLVPFLYNKENEYVTEEYENGILWNNELLRLISDELDVAYCDITPAIITNQDYWLDDCHLPAAGVKIKATHVADCISTALEKNKAGPAN